VDSLKNKCYLSLILGRAPSLRFGSPPSGVRFARCFARFAPPGGSRKNLATRAKKTSGKVLRAFFWGMAFLLLVLCS
jgi:hypothetical protein